MLKISNRWFQPHLQVLLLGLGPVQHALFPDGEEADQNDAYIPHHLPEAEHRQTLLLQSFEHDCPGNEKNSFYIKQNKQHGNHIELHRKPALSISSRSNAAFICRQCVSRSERSSHCRPPAPDHDLCPGPLHREAWLLVRCSGKSSRLFRSYDP